MSTKGSVRIVPVDLADSKLERRVLFLKHKALPEPRVDFKKFASSYMLDLIRADLENDVHELKKEDKAIELTHSDKALDKFTKEDIESYLARKKVAVYDT